MPWLGLPSSSFFHLNVQVRTDPRVGRTPKLSQSLLVQIPKMLYLNSAVHCGFCFGGSFSQAVLTETPSFSVPLGPRARLTCTLRSGIGIGDNNIYWTSRCRGALPGFTCAATETQTSHWGLESPLYSLDPEKPQKILQICTSLNYR